MRSYIKIKGRIMKRSLSQKGFGKISLLKRPSAMNGLRLVHGGVLTVVYSIFEFQSFHKFYSGIPGLLINCTFRNLGPDPHVAIQKNNFGK